MDEAERPGGDWSAILVSGHFGQIVLLAFGVWLHAADELMVSTVTPAMTGEIGGEEFVAWLIALYETGSILAGAASALFVLRHGARRCMSIAAFVYFAGCLVSGFAGAMPEMLAGRFIQGLGGGAMIAISFAAVHRIIPSRYTTRVYAIISVVWGVSAFSGPMIGAVFADAGIWRGAFFFYALQAAIFCAVVWYRLRDDRASAHRAQGVRLAALLARLALLAVGVVCVAWAGTYEKAAMALLLVAAGLALIVLFARLDSAAGPARLLPYEALNPLSAPGAVLAVVLFMSAASVGLVTYGPLILSRVHGLDAIWIGGILLFESVGWSIVAVTVSSLSNAFDRRLILGGFSAVSLGVAILWLAIIPGPIWLITVAAFLIGGGFGMAWAHMVRRATDIVPAGETERIATAMPTVQRLGYALGAAFAGIAANSAGFADARTASEMVAPAHWIFGLLVLPAVVGLLAAHIFLRSRNPHEPISSD